MKNPFASIVLLAAAIGGLIAQASAAPLVTLGSTYSVYIEGEISNTPTIATGTFDGDPTSISSPSLLLVLTENETDLGSGRSRITVDVAANGDLFPGDRENGIIGLGVVDADGLDFNVPVSLEHALIRFYSGDVLEFDTGDLVPIGMPVVPWDGIFPGTDLVFIIGRLGGLGISRLTFEFEIAGPAQQVPEPGSLLLGAVALLALAGARRGNHVSAVPGRAA